MLSSSCLQCDRDEAGKMEHQDKGVPRKQNVFDQQKNKGIIGNRESESKLHLSKQRTLTRD